MLVARTNADAPATTSAREKRFMKIPLVVEPSKATGFHCYQKFAEEDEFRAKGHFALGVFTPGRFKNANIAATNATPAATKQARWKPFIKAFCMDRFNSARIA